MKLTREEWDLRWLAHYDIAYERNGRMHQRAFEEAWRVMRARHGERPKDGPRGLPWWARIGLSFVANKLAGNYRQEVSPMVQRIVLALVYGISAAAVPLQAAFADAVLSGNEIMGVVSALLVAAWGKFSSSQTLISPGPKPPSV